MKIFALLGLGAVLLFSSQVAAEEGEAIFKANGCITCHKKTTGGSSINPSLPAIAQAYHGKEDQLLKYLKGEADSIVKPEMSAKMQRQIKKTSALSDSDRKALADFIMSHSE